MTTLRCTRRLLKWLNVEPTVAEVSAPTNALGDWYANLLFTRHHRLIIGVNDISRLSVLVPVRGIVDVGASFIISVRELLLHLGFPEELVSNEIDHMKPMQIGFTLSRSVLSTMNEMVFQARYFLNRPDNDLLMIAGKLCETPCGPSPYFFPIDTAREKLLLWSKGHLH